MTIEAGEEYASLPDPRSYRVSLNTPDAHLWKIVCEEEIESLESNKTWTLVKRDKHMHLLR